jgi:hypothetical protein
MGTAGSHHEMKNKTTHAAITTNAEAARITDHVVCMLADQATLLQQIPAVSQAC